MNIKFSLIFISVIFLVGTVSAADAHLFTNITDDVIFNLSNEGNAYLTQSFFGGGDVSSPTYSWLSDIDSGMFSLLADKIGWGLGGVTKLTLDGVSLNVSSDLDICISSGNCLSAMSGGGGSPWVSTADYIYNTTASVGIGTESPARNLHIYENTASAAGNPQFQIEQDGTGDSVMQFLLTATRAWSVGVDNSDSDKFKIASTGTDGWTDTRLTVTTSGNVGIGTNSPTAQLELLGGGLAIRETDDGNNAAQLYSNTVHGFMRLNNAGTANVFFATDGSDNYILNGNVGIGTDSPSQKLEIQKDQNAETAILIQNDNDDTASKSCLELDAGAEEGDLCLFSASYTTSNQYVAQSLLLESSNLASGGLGLSTLGNKPINLWTNGVRRMTILGTDGKVGIGTASPTEELEVKGDMILDDVGTALFIKGNEGTNIISMLTNSTATGGGNSRIQMYSSGESASFSMGRDNADNRFKIVNGFALDTNPLFVVEAGGDVGIGTVNPPVKLSVTDSVTNVSLEINPSAGKSLIQSYNRVDAGYEQMELRASNYSFEIGTTPAITIEADGDVGIGTATPYRQTEIVDGTGGEIYQLQLRNDATADGTGVGIKFTPSTASSSVIGAVILANRTNAGSSGDTDLMFQTSDGTTLGTKMIIKGTGKVGIGTNAPEEALEVEGAIQLTDSTLEGTIEMTTLFTAELMQFDADKDGNSNGGFNFITGNDKFVTIADGGITAYGTLDINGFTDITAAGTVSATGYVKGQSCAYAKEGMITAEDGAMVSNAGMALGNGQAYQGAPQPCAGVVTSITGTCPTCSSGVNEVAMELRVNGAAQTCDTAQLTSAYDTDVTACAVSFSALDRLNCYSKTETGTATGLCTLTIQYN